MNLQFQKACQSNPGNIEARAFLMHQRGIRKAEQPINLPILAEEHGTPTRVQHLLPIFEDKNLLIVKAISNQHGASVRGLVL